MKRIFAFFMLTVVLFCAAFPAALADINPKDFFNPGQREAMQAAGRAMDHGVAWAEETEGETPFAVFLRKTGETAQLTLLEKQGEGWQVTACNDTIPVSLVSTASLSAWRGDIWQNEGSEQEQRPHFSLTIDKMEFPNNRENPHYQLYCCIQFGRTDAGTWALEFANIVPFEEAAEGRSPYYLLNRAETGWVYCFYEEIISEAGLPMDRSPMIAETHLPLEALVPFEDLAGFSLPEFLDFLRSLAPEEYEHTPYPYPAREQIVPTPQAEEASPAVLQISLYYNPDGGKYYHVSRTCPSVSTVYWPLTSLSMEEWTSPAFARLLPCPICGAPERPGQ